MWLRGGPSATHAQVQLEYSLISPHAAQANADRPLPVLHAATELSHPIPKKIRITKYYSAKPPPPHLAFPGDLPPLPPWMIYLRFPSAPLPHKIAIRPAIFCSQNFIFRTMATLPSFHPRGYGVSICCSIGSMALIRQLYTVSQPLTDLAHPGSSRGPQHATDELQRPRGDPQVW